MSQIITLVEWDTMRRQLVRAAKALGQQVEYAAEQLGRSDPEQFADLVSTYLGTLDMVQGWVEEDREAPDSHEADCLPLIAGARCASCGNRLEAHIPFGHEEVICPQTSTPHAPLSDRRTIALAVDAAAAEGDA